MKLLYKITYPEDCGVDPEHVITEGTGEDLAEAVYDLAEALRHRFSEDAVIHQSFFEMVIEFAKGGRKFVHSDISQMEGDYSVSLVI